ncbi:unnamed protein product [Heligmosomoides polygyrus]|uniref:DOMON domain-containing protein n=1 Tax=Heligmosomoides polygyrus TaxID=6339 RepID=A0A183FWB6_HELPZ|nr:unnamed protein product [Heligmosomoides polygyrus]
MLLPIYIVLGSVGAAHSNCYYNDPGGYSLRWLVLGDKLVFRLDYSNFSSNAVTGIGFGSTSFTTPLLRTVPSFNTSGNALSTFSSSYRNRNLQAEFSRPIAANSSNLSSCQTWNFITTPARNENGKYNITSANTKSQRVCNIKEECDALKMLRTMSANRFDFNAGHSPYFGSSIVEMSAAPRIGGNRRKRQTGYQPTNNIYGYNYDSSASPSDAAKLVVNPNYAYLNDALSEGYARNYVQAETQYAQNNQNNGALSFTVDDVA